MKVRVEIRQTRFFAGNVEMTEEEYIKFDGMRNDKEMDVINAMMLKGLKKDGGTCELEVFLNLSEEQNNEG